MSATAPASSEYRRSTDGWMGGGREAAVTRRVADSIGCGPGVGFHYRGSAGDDWRGRTGGRVPLPGSDGRRLADGDGG